MSVCEDSLMTDETIRTVQENLFKLKETAVNTLHLFEIFRRKIYQGCEQVWKWSWDFPNRLQTRTNQKVNYLITSYIWVLIDGSIADLLSMNW